MKGPASLPLTRQECSSVLWHSAQEWAGGQRLGLPIVRALADRLGANVRLHDRKGGTGLLAVVHFRRSNGLADC
jgi:hypothetical protein